MPMNRALYPKNWNAIARSIKEAANWTCQGCDRPCKKPSEPWDIFEDKLWYLADLQWVRNYWDSEEDDEFGEILIPRRGRFVLTTAHLNHNPDDNRPENLRALCPKCHLMYDAAHHAASRRKNRRLQQEKQGQLVIDLQGMNA